VVKTTNLFFAVVQVEAGQHVNSVNETACGFLTS